MSLLVHEGELRAETILKHHSLFRVLIAAAGTLFLGAWLVLLFEENAKGSNIHSYPDALWWAIVTVTTVGTETASRSPPAAGPWRSSSCWWASASSACSPPRWLRCS